MLFICDEDVVPYEQLRHNFFLTKENHIIWKYKYQKDKKPMTKHFERRDNFTKEINNMLEASEKSILKLNRNTPIAIFSRLYTHNSCNYFFLKRKFIRKSGNKETLRAMKELFQQFDYTKNIKYDTNIYLGILAMEYIDPHYSVYCNIIKPIIYDDVIGLPGNEKIHKHDSVNLSKFSHRLRWLYNTTRYELLRLAIDTGFTQGDYHTENILVNEKDRLSIVIDFGKAKKIPNVSYLNELWCILKAARFKNKEENFNHIQRILNAIYLTTFDDNKNTNSECKWVKNIVEEDIDMLIYIHNMRNKYIENQSSYIFSNYIEKREEYIYNGICETDHAPLNIWNVVKIYM
jgi:hypothetical protein